MRIFSSRLVITRRAALAAAGLATIRMLPARAGSPGTIRLGVSAPLTAQFAQNGLWMKNGVTLAVKDINDRGGSTAAGSR